MSVPNEFVEMLEEGDLFFPFKDWPPIAKEYMLKLHKSRNERYYLTRFLVYNGLSPKIASNWIMRYGTYDDSAKRDQAGMTVKAATTDFFRVGKIFNMRYGRTDAWNDPPPASEPAFQPPPEGYYYKREEEPQPVDDPFIIDWKTVVLDKFPRPQRKHFPDKVEFAMALATWRAETWKYVDYLKSFGFHF